MTKEIAEEWADELGGKAVPLRAGHKGWVVRVTDSENGRSPAADLLTPYECFRWRLRAIGVLP